MKENCNRMAAGFEWEIYSQCHGLWVHPPNGDQRLSADLIYDPALKSKGVKNWIVTFSNSQTKIVTLYQRPNRTFTSVMWTVLLSMKFLSLKIYRDPKLLQTSSENHIYYPNLICVLLFYFYVLSTLSVLFKAKMYIEVLLSNPYSWDRKVVLYLSQEDLRIS